MNDLQRGGFYIYRPVAMETSPNVDYCSNPSGALYAYEDVMNTGHQGSVLEEVVIDGQVGGVEACQRTCDVLFDCVGFTVESNRCALRNQGSITSQNAVRWYQKVR